MGCCDSENRKNKIIYHLYESNSNEEIENFGTKINENKIGINNAELEEKKKGNGEKIKEQRYEEKEEEKNEVNDEEESSSKLSFSTVSLNQKSSYDNNELKIELYPKNLPKIILKKNLLKISYLKKH